MYCRRTNHGILYQLYCVPDRNAPASAYEGRQESAKESTEAANAQQEGRRATPVSAASFPSSPLAPEAGRGPDGMKGRKHTTIDECFQPALSCGQSRFGEISRGVIF